MSVNGTRLRPLPRGSSIAVIGAGIIGTSAAFALAERGYKVTLYDRAEPGRTGPSWGNAGHVVGSGIFPLAEPGIAWSGLKMLLDPDAPLKVPPAYYAAIAPWLWRFWQSSRGEAYARSLAALTALSLGSVDETEDLWARAGIGTLMRRDPALYLYESDQSYQMSLGHWDQRGEVGLRSTHLDARDIAELEPNLAPIFARGVVSHEWGIVTDPFEVVTRLFLAGQARGVLHERAKVDAIAPQGDLVTVTANGGARTFDAALVAAGVWSKTLAQSLGEPLPVEAERGYNLTYPGRAGLVGRPLVLADRGVVVTGLEPGLRLGGWTELGGIELPQSQPLEAHAGDYRRGAAGSRRCAGQRMDGPSPLDAGLSPGDLALWSLPAVFYAVGHGHYGLSQSARTARMIVELVSEVADAQHAPFGIGRFA